MDNAQKAIMIGVGLFIAIIIISAVLLITNIGTDLINNSRNQMSNISKSLQNQITSAFDGKTVSGAEVIAACQQYENSDSISIMIKVNKSDRFQTGKYHVGIRKDINGLTTEQEIDTLFKSPRAGGIKVYPGSDSNRKAYTSYQELVSGSDESKIHKHSLSEIQAVGGVSSTQTYYSYIMKDKDSDTVMGVIFIRKGLYK